MGGEVVADQSADVVGTLPETQTFTDLLQVVHVHVGTNELLFWVDLHHLRLELLQGCLKPHPESLNGGGEVSALLLLSEFLLGGDAETVHGVFIELCPVFICDFVGRVVEVDALLGVVVEGAGGEATFLAAQAMRIQTHQVHLLLHQL